MEKILKVIQHEFIGLVKQKGYIIISLLFPLISFAAIGGYQIFQNISAEEEESEVPAVGYVDQIGGFIDTSQTAGIDLIRYSTPENANIALIAEDIDEYFVITPDYITTGQIDRFTLKRELEMSGTVRYEIRNFLLYNLFKDRFEDDLLERAKNPAWFNSTRLEKTGEVSTEQGGMVSVFLVPYIFMLLFWIAVLSAAFTLIEGLGDEKENRVMEILLSSVSAKQLMLGKIIGLGAAGFLQIVFWFVTAFIVAGMASTTVGGMFASLEIPGRLIGFGLCYFILGYLLFAVVFSCIGAIVPTYRDGQQLSFFFIMPAAIPLILIAFIVENTDHVLTTFLTLFPVTAPMSSIIRLAVGEIPVWQIVLSMVLLIISIIALFLIGTKIFRTYLLMYGKRPAFRDIFRSLRQA
ncbi:MAG: ABC transporter permease [Dehalococcoidales bacterium]|nr:MAG: ABC transporter permease [Dehalococcoidales bacterium]